MKIILEKIKFWLWWKFKATEKEKFNYQLFCYGTGIMKGNRFIDIKRLIIK